MRKTILRLAILFTLFSCSKNSDITDTCITSCSSSTPGLINIAVEDHTGLDIKNFVMEINGAIIPFNLIPKIDKGKFSCWQSFDEIASIALIRFGIGDNVVHEETVNYQNLDDKREYAIDISSDTSTGLRIQLVSSPDCISSAN